MEEPTPAPFALSSMTDGARGHELVISSLNVLLLMGLLSMKSSDVTFLRLQMCSIVNSRQSAIDSSG